MLWLLSRCHRWAHDCPCTGPGSAGAAGGGTALGVVRGRPYELKHRLPHVQKLVEDVGDGVIPAALEEGQAGWSHGFLVFLVEIKSAEGPLGQLIAG